MIDPSLNHLLACLNSESGDVLPTDQHFPKAPARITPILRHLPKSRWQGLELVPISIKQHHRLKDRSLAGVVAPDDEIGTAQIPEPDLFEATELLEFKGGDHGNVGGG
jgi:hypothetical protein